MSVPASDINLKKSALNDVHRQLGARMVEFAGWDMPVQYRGLIQEHLAVRNHAGIFDVSHMGEVEIRGSAALDTVQKVTCNDAAHLAIGQCQYSALTTPQGTFVDDILVYRMAQDRFFLCVNASNQEKDFQWIRENAVKPAEVLFRSPDFAQLAIQGPRSLEILKPLTRINLTAMKYYWFAQGNFADMDVIISRTGYTGEDGFEIYCPPRQAETLWSRILDAGKPMGIEPVGLAARNTLRLEAGMSLYGHEIDETTTVLEANLSWICKLEKHDFIGRAALLKQRESGITRILVGFEMIERGIARDHYPVQMPGRSDCYVTSGSPAPSLNKNIGLAYLPTNHRAIGTEFNIMIREKPVRARVVATPFYRRSKPA